MYSSNPNLFLFGLFDVIFYASSQQKVAVSDHTTKTPQGLLSFGLYFYVSVRSTILVITNLVIRSY